MRHQVSWTIVAACLLSTSSLCFAAEYEVEFDNTFGRTVNYTLNGGPLDADIKAGVFTWTVVSSNSSNFPNFSPGKQIQTFCTELTQFVGSEYDGADVTDVSNPGDPGAPSISSIRASLLSELFNRFYKIALDESGGVGERKDRAAAFQLAVWELTHEGTNADDANLVSNEMLSISDGNFQAEQVSGETGATTLANTWLADLEGGRPISDNLFGWINDEHQDQLVFVPLPPSLAMAAVGLIGAVAGRKRLRRCLAC